MPLGAGFGPAVWEEIVELGGPGSVYSVECIFEPLLGVYAMRLGTQKKLPPPFQLYSKQLS